MGTHIDVTTSVVTEICYKKTPQSRSLCISWSDQHSGGVEGLNAAPMPIVGCFTKVS